MSQQISFSDFFECANEVVLASAMLPFLYQRKFAEDEVLPDLLNVPTGSGKTATGVLGWLYRRRFAQAKIKDSTPRRLVYCLPMRVLVEQTSKCARDWLTNLGMLADDPADSRTVDGWALNHGDAGQRIAISVIMGGTDRDEMRDWASWPERDAILIGTQDMLLSRALNRGYAASRARWPIDFSLLNNDCLWIFDEVQLMGSGLATSAQLAAFRNGGKQSRPIGTIGACQSLWMSATSECNWLDTVDHDASRLIGQTLAPEERNPPPGTDPDSPAGQLATRLRASKKLCRFSLPDMAEPEEIAGAIIVEHRSQTLHTRRPILTAVVLNTVDLASEVYNGVRTVTSPTKKRKKAREDIVPPVPAPELLLLHSRFRSGDRHQVVKKLLLAQQAIDAISKGQPVPIASDPELTVFVDRVSQHGAIVVSTQVIEAGVDISAKLLVTQLAPWGSLVQRFGRCNRRGEHAEAVVLWLDLPNEENAALPYELGELNAARAHLAALEGKSVGPNALDTYREEQGIKLPYRPQHVLRRKDLIELFDTTPDLAGNDLDISRYIRDGDEHDVHAFWRTVPPGGRPDNDAAPAGRDELCPIKFHSFAKFVELHKDRIWRWDFLAGRWTKPRTGEIFPGQMFLVASDAGGYLSDEGFSPRSDRIVDVKDVERALPSTDSYDSDGLSYTDRWQTIAEHTDAVCKTLDPILGSLVLDESIAACLRDAARWHDFGKAHEVFQAAIDDGQDGRRPRPPEWAGCRFVAKAPGKRRDRNGAVVDIGFWCHKGYDRKHFRHELASALAVLQCDSLVAGVDHDLIAYLIAAHHGKVRLSIRSLPGERLPCDSNGRKQFDRQFARGIWDGDRLPTTDLGGDDGGAPEIILSLQPMQLGLGPDGQPSWADRVLRLRDRADLGIFRLAFLESLLRAADCRASAPTERQSLPSPIGIASGVTV
ncbi:MAG TPA: DEAD/DEAH box helicase [Planctomycetaceae bacterium]